ncbi:MAG: TonB-dependent receptor [Ignavibacteriales bacterium]|nr:TonB-dependent receptor [Ignavibacteriales bacterium]
MRGALFLLIASMVAISAQVSAQDGKLRGRVTDGATGEPLIGANVIMEETTIGAASDINGEYIVLSVPPGTYTVKASFIGYGAITVSNIRVSANLTTTQDFHLQSTLIQTREIVITAERPLIQRNTTNTVRMQTQEDIRSLSFRGLQNILALSAGVMQQDGTLYVRGGRAGEVAYFIDGATATNPLFRSEAISPIQEAIEEIQLQSGGYTAEFGGANSGIVRTTMRTGGSQFRASLDVQTDDFAKPGKQFLGTSARGFRNVVLTVSGPILENLRFFVAGQHNYLRNRSSMYLEPFSFENMVTDAFGTRVEGTPLPGTIEIKRNYLYKNWRNENTAQGTLLWDMNPWKVRFSGSYGEVDLPTGHSWPDALRNLFWRRDYRNKTKNMLANLRVTHVLGPKAFYEVGASYLNRDFRAYDPDFGDDWKLYNDSVASRDKGYMTANGSTEFLTRFQGPANYSTIYGFAPNFPDPGFTHEFAPNNSYQLNSQNSIGLTVDFTSQVNPRWELKAGGKIDSWTMRLFSVGAIGTLNTFLAQSGDTYTADKLAGDANLRKEYDIFVQRQGGMNLYGYDIDGNKIDDGFAGPRKPFFASAYIQNKFEFNDLVLNLGVRYELFDMKNVAPIDYVNPTWDEHLDYFTGDDWLKETDPSHLLLPRVSFSFPVNDRTVFYAMYGKYAQLPELNRLYDGVRFLASRISPQTRVGYALSTSGGMGFLVKPERTTQYEVGIRQILFDNFAFTATGFYKDLKDQIQLNRVTNDLGVPLFVSYGNPAFGTVKGLELTLELRRTNRLRANVNYTLSDARGTASNPVSSFSAVSADAAGRFPSFINQLDYNQTHRGTIMLDYRWGNGEGGKILQGFGANAVLTFNSGHPYTKGEEPEELGQSNPWNVGMASVHLPAEPINSSSTPWVFNVDLSLNKVFFFDDFTGELYVNVFNLFDTKHVVNVFRNTGTPTDDGWLRSHFAAPYREIPNYDEFYRAININNRWAYVSATGRDIYGAPREVRVGLKLEL